VPIKRRRARGRRPGVEGKRGSQVLKSVVDAWIKEAAEEQGVRSIICLLDERQLRFYEGLPSGDLIRYYRSKGAVAGECDVDLSLSSLFRWNSPHRNRHPLHQISKKLMGFL
jgi:hypothetical protein